MDKKVVIVVYQYLKFGQYTVAEGPRNVLVFVAMTVLG